jgi:ribonucleotide monophosphatase NagD (HAD superfamily)
MGWTDAGHRPSVYCPRSGRRGILAAAPIIPFDTEQEAIALANGTLDTLGWADFRLGHDESEAELAGAVLVARDPAFSHDQLAAACRAIWSGARFYAIALDRAIPVERGLIPGTGPLVRAIQHATRTRPTFLGKPSPWPLRAALRRLGLHPSCAVYVGDSASSDVIMGNRAGCRTVLVLSGGAQPPAGAIAARARPEAVLGDVTQLDRWLRDLRYEDGPLRLRKARDCL